MGCCGVCCRSKIQDGWSCSRKANPSPIPTTSTTAIKPRDIFEGGVAGHFPLIPASIGGKGEPERVWGQSVSGNFFPILEVPMAIGRPIVPEDDQVSSRNHVVVLSNSLWRRRFGADANILNRDVALNGQRYTVVGIAPARFLRGRSRHSFRFLGAACPVGRDHARSVHRREHEDQRASMGDA